MGYKGVNFLEGKVEIDRWWDGKKESVLGTVRFGTNCEGPPGAAHGGAVAAAMDDALGTLVWRMAGFSAAGIPTVQLSVQYKKFVPLETDMVFRTRAKRGGAGVAGRRTLHVQGDLCSASGTIHASAEGLFLVRGDAGSILPWEEAMRRFGTLSADPLKGLQDFYARARL